MKDLVIGTQCYGDLCVIESYLSLDGEPLLLSATNGEGKLFFLLYSDKSEYLITELTRTELDGMLSRTTDMRTGLTSGNKDGFYVLLKNESWSSVNERPTKMIDVPDAVMPQYGVYL